MADDKQPYEFKFTDDVIIQQGLIVPITDAHMHIQSNDIAPLPIMLGILNYKTSTMLHKKLIPENLKILHVTDEKLEKQINFNKLNYLSLPNREIAPTIGGGPFVCDFANGKVDISIDNAMKELPTLTETVAKYIEGTIISMLLSTSEGTKKLKDIDKEIYEFVNPKDENQRRLKISNLLTVPFIKYFLKDYGTITQYNSFLVAGIYMNDSLTTDSKPIDISSKDKERDGLVKARADQKNLFYDVSNHYYEKRYDEECSVLLTPSFSMSIIHGMELMYAHYWGAYGIPIYIQYGIGDEKQLYYITDNLINPNNSKEKWYNIYDVNKTDINKFRISYNDKYLKISLKNSLFLNNNELGNNGVKYTHFLKIVPEAEKEQFEDLVKHVSYTEAAILKYPLKYIPFYHVDPRRFFAPVDAISKYHNFFLCEGEHFNWIDGSKIQEELISDNTFLKYKMNFNNDVKQNLIYKNGGSWNKGLFWGIKMYVALGYPPYLGVDNRKAKDIFFCIGENDYKGLLEMYKFCAESEVPITCHGSPQGMTIADPGTYLKEYLKKNTNTKYGRITKSNFLVDGKSFMHGIGLIDSFSDPDSWRVVFNALGEENKHKLRLCLAHFGGKDFLSGKYKKNSPYNWFNSIAYLIRDFKGVYADISNFAYDKFVSMPGKITKSIYDKVKNKVSENFIDTVYDKYNNYKFKENKEKDAKTLALLRLHIILETKDKLECYKDLYTTANNIASFLNNNTVPNLQHRILFGTDWPMCEMETMGVLKYSSAMFVLLQLVTALIGNKWDAWHQFAVINPLRFLGLLENPDENQNEYKIKMDKITKMKEGIEDYISKSIKKDNISIDQYSFKVDDIKKELNKQYLYMENIAKEYIPSANRIIDQNNIMLLTGMKQGSKA